jgi:hypothetical protein
MLARLGVGCARPRRDRPGAATPRPTPSAACRRTSPPVSGWRWSKKLSRCTAAGSGWSQRSVRAAFFILPLKEMPRTMSVVCPRGNAVRLMVLRLLWFNHPEHRQMYAD